MPEKVQNEPDDLEEELEPEGCMGLGWGTLGVLAVIVIVAGLAVMGLVRVYDLQREQLELEMMRNAAFQSTINAVIGDLTDAQKALSQNNPDSALDSLRAAHKGLENSLSQSSENSAPFVVTVAKKCVDTETKIQERMRAAAQEAQTDVADLMKSVKMLRVAD